MGGSYMKKRKMKPDEIRSLLITFAISLSYVVFLVMGIVISKYNPWVMKYIDYAYIPISLSTILFLYLFAVTYEQKRKTEVSQKVKTAARLYGEGKSFQEIKDLLELSSVADVKRLITKYCALEGDKE